MSKYVTNNVPSFAFTLEKTSDNSFHHFLIKEEINDDMVKYSITDYKPKSGGEKKLRESLKKFDNNNQSGGEKKKKRYKKRRYDDDDDDDDDFDDLDDVYDRVRRQKYLHQSQPILYWWYNPLAYQLNNFYIPTFTHPLTPYVQVDLGSAYW